MTGHGHGNGAFQPPKNSVTISAETMNTFTYSAKKKNPKRIPEYSVAKPATISRVGLGQVERRPVRLGGRGDEEDQRAERLLEDVPVGEPAGLVLRRSWLRLIVPASRISPTTDRVSGIS